MFGRWSSNQSPLLVRLVSDSSQGARSDMSASSEQTKIRLPFNIRSSKLDVGSSTGLPSLNAWCRYRVREHELLRPLHQRQRRYVFHSMFEVLSWTLEVQPIRAHVPWAVTVLDQCLSVF